MEGASRRIFKKIRSVRVIAYHQTIIYSTLWGWTKNSTQEKLRIGISDQLGLSWKLKLKQVTLRTIRWKSKIKLSLSLQNGWMQTRKKEYLAQIRSSDLGKTCCFLKGKTISRN